MESEAEWVRVAPDLYRIAVPGGWLYESRTTDEYGVANSSALAFVPNPQPAESGSAR